MPYRLIPATAALLLLATNALAQTVLSGDHSVDGNLCAGPDCTNSESFIGSADIKLKSFDTRILFEDTSTASGAPTVDWELRTNDAGSGFDYFAIRNADTGTQIFRLDDGAPTNSLYVDDDGNVGLGTSLPQADLHVLGDGSVPAVTLEETGATPASWTIYGGPFLQIGNVVPGTPNAFPVAIDPSAVTNSLYLGNGELVFNQNGVDNDFRIESDLNQNGFFFEGSSGNVSIGTNAPSATLHVSRADSTAQILVEDTGASGAQELFKLSNNGGSFFTFDNTASDTTWFFVHEDAAPNRFIITDGVADGPEMTLSADGDLTIPGQLFTAGSCAAGCDRVFDADYPLPTIPQQAAMMRTLKHLPNIGPTPEDGPFNITAMTGGILNELEKAHLYIAELEERLAAVEALLAQDR